MKELKDVRDGHAELDKSILQIIRSTKSTEINFGNLLALEQKWKNAETVGLGIAKLVGKAEAAQEKASKAEAQATKVYYPTDRDTIQDEEGVFNELISEKVQRRLKITKVDCDGMEGYERQKAGTGLKGEYFDNEAWVGKGLKKTDSKIHFSWSGVGPIDGINPYNYSIKWESFIKAPFTGQFTFAVESNDSAMITFNNKIIIAHNMYTATGESQDRNNRWMDREVFIVTHPKVDRTKATSEPIYLVGGNKYR